MGDDGLGDDGTGGIGMGDAPSLGGDDGMGGIGGFGGFGDSMGLGGFGDTGTAVGDMGFGGIGLNDAATLAEAFGLPSFEADPSMFYDMPATSMQAETTPVQSNLGFPNEDSLFSKAMRGILGFGKNAAIGKATQAMGIPSMAVPMAKGFMGNTPNSVAQGFMGSMMGMLGVPGLAAQGVMGMANAMGAPNNGMTGAASPTGGNQGGSMGGGFGDILGGLAGLYNYNKSQNNLENTASGLAGMYGQDSPFSQALRQQLERRDAAGGRRSQYGPREVELQARLAQLMSNNAGAIGNIRTQQNTNRAQGLAQLIALLNKSGASNAIGSGLQGLFNRGINSGVSSGWFPSGDVGSMGDNPFGAVDDMSGIWGG